VTSSPIIILVWHIEQSLPAKASVAIILSAKIFPIKSGIAKVCEILYCLFFLANEKYYSLHYPLL
jgi:hypothetical protein